MGGGLGNQMASYPMYLGIKQANPDDDIFTETYIFDIEEVNADCSMWNGYELQKVFGIEVPDIRDKFPIETQKEQIEAIRKDYQSTRDYNVSFCKVMKNYGIKFGEDFEEENSENQKAMSEPEGIGIKDRIKNIFTTAAPNRFIYFIKGIGYTLVYSRKTQGCGSWMLNKDSNNRFYGTSFDFMKDKDINKALDEPVRKGFTFKNIDTATEAKAKEMSEHNSVAIHARRGDFLVYNGDLYKYGFFKKSVKYIKRRVNDPVFYIFSDDVKWCENNRKTLGLTETDEIYFMTTNSGEDSYKDMYLMSKCRHNIFTKSSFGWWGAYLNDNPDKITICQRSPYISTVQF